MRKRESVCKKQQFTYINGAQVIIQSGVYSTNEFEWWIVTVIFISDFNSKNIFCTSKLPSGAIITSVIITVIIAVVLIAISIVVGVMGSLWITRNLTKVSDAMVEAANMQLESVKKSYSNLSHFTEIRAMQVSLFLLLHNLKEYRAFLPANVLESIDRKYAMEEQSDISIRVNPKEAMYSSNKIVPSHSSFHSENSHSSNSNRAKFDLNLANKQVTVLVVKMNNFKSMIKQIQTEECVNFIKTNQK